MAIIKHKAMKNSNYSAAIEYLEYEHDKSGNVKKDESGSPILRDNFIIEGINCEPQSFQNECRKVNEFYKKNQKRDEVKSHSYIISFDPRDAIDNGLTMQEVQQFGMEFAIKYLPGYQTIVCTHADGNNGSGNLHCHIVINSIRIQDVPREVYMDRFSDNLAGTKHHCSVEFQRFIKSKVMEMCQDRGLYQTNLLEPAPERVTDKEYYLSLHKRILGDESFQTRKEYIRNAIRECAGKSNDLEEFKLIMRCEFDIIVKDSRGRLSFQLTDKERGITERQLGTIYTKSFIEKVIAREEFYFDFRANEVYRTNDYVPSNVKRLVNIAENAKAMESKGYEHVLVLSNLKKSAETINMLTEKNIKGWDELEKSINRVSEIYNSTTKEIKSLEKQISEMRTVLKLKEEISQIQPIIDELKSGKCSVKFRKQHEPDLIVYKAARERLKHVEPDFCHAVETDLRESIDTLSERKNVLYEQRSQMKKDLTDLQNAKHNIAQLFEEDRSQQKERQSRGR